MIGIGIGTYYITLANNDGLTVDIDLETVKGGLILKTHTSALWVAWQVIILGKKDEAIGHKVIGWGHGDAAMDEELLSETLAYHGAA